VFTTLNDPVDQRLVVSFPQPGGNVTGVAAAPTAGKRLELLKGLVPNMTRAAALVNSTNAATPSILGETHGAAGALGLLVKPFVISTANDLDQIWSAMAASRPEGLVVANDVVLFRIGARIRELAARLKLPVVYGHREDALEGGLAAFSTILAEQFIRAAGYVDRILRGADPGRLPVQRADRFEYHHQPQDRQGARPHDPAVPAGAGGSCDRVSRRSFVEVRPTRGGAKWDVCWQTMWPQ
jgi:putative ABC transport system substrate-binding protein